MGRRDINLLEVRHLGLSRAERICHFLGCKNVDPNVEHPQGRLGRETEASDVIHSTSAEGLRKLEFVLDVESLELVSRMGGRPNLLGKGLNFPLLRWSV